MSRSHVLACVLVVGCSLGAALTQRSASAATSQGASQGSPSTAQSTSTIPPQSTLAAGSTNSSDSLAGACADSLVDQSTGACLVADSVPALGKLHPMSLRLNVHPTSGNVGINISNPTAKLHVDQSGTFLTSFLTNIRSSIYSEWAGGTLGIESIVRGPCTPISAGNKAIVAKAEATASSPDALNIGIEASASGNSTNLAGWFPQGAVAIGGLSVIAPGPTSWPTPLKLYVEGEGPSGVFWPLLPGAEAIIASRDTSAELGLFATTRCALYFGEDYFLQGGGVGAVYYEHPTDWLGFRTANVDHDIGITAGGRLGVGTRTPSERLSVVGNICATGTIGTCSDERFKTDVSQLSGALEAVGQLRGIRFKWRAQEFPSHGFSQAEQIGFLAQEVAGVLPEVVSEGSDGTYSLDYGRLTPLLVEAIKEQQAEIQALRSKVSDLEELQAEMQEVKFALSALSSSR